MTSLLYHDGNRALQDEFGSPPARGPAGSKADAHGVHRRRQGLHRVRASISFSRPRTRRASPIARSRAARRVLCASPGRRSWRFPTMTATACSRASAISPSIRMSDCCSSPCTTSRSGCASTASRGSRATIRCCGEIAGAQLIVRVTASAIFPNCPRYIPALTLTSPRSTRRNRTPHRSSLRGNSSTCSRTWSRRAHRR